MLFQAEGCRHSLVGGKRLAGNLPVFSAPLPFIFKRQMFRFGQASSQHFQERRMGLILGQGGILELPLGAENSQFIPLERKELAVKFVLVQKMVLGLDDPYCFVQGIRHALFAGGDQHGIQPQFLGVMLGDIVAEDQVAALVFQPEKFLLDIAVIVDGADCHIVLHQIGKLHGAIGDVGVAHYRKLSGIVLGVFQAAEHVIDGYADFYYRNA